MREHPELHWKGGNKAQYIYNIGVEHAFVEELYDPWVIGIESLTGCGKTFQMIERYIRNKGWVYCSPVKTHKSSLDEWRWDNYSPKKHKIVWCKEVRDTTFSIQYWNTLTDPMAFQVRMMGVSDPYVRPKIIFIETNQHFHTWYSKESTSERQAFFRRFSVMSRWLTTREEVNNFFDNVERFIGNIEDPAPAPPKTTETGLARMRWCEASWNYLNGFPYDAEALQSHAEVEEF